MVGLVAGGGALAGDKHDIVIKHDGKVRIIVVDDDGDRHEQVYEFDSDHPRPFLGVVLGRPSSEGVRVLSIVDDSGADRAGIEAGDIIVSIDGDEVDSSWDLTQRILQSEAGDRVDVEVIRDGDRQTLTAELGERQGFGSFAFGFDSDMLEGQLGQLSEHLENLDLDLDFDFDFGGAEPNVRHFSWNFGHSRPKLGVELVGTTPELRRHMGAEEDEGVLVGRVMSDMPAETAGIEVGDLIIAVDGEKIDSVGDLRRALNDVDGMTIDIEVIRDRRPMTLRATMPESDQRESDFRRHRDRDDHATPASQRS